MRNPLPIVRAICRREFAAYFATPLAYVFLFVFLTAAAACTFQLGALYERDQADLEPFFTFHPWLYLLLVPAVSMRTWAEERSSGTLELLLTLPLTRAAAVIGKYLAGLGFLALALVLTAPVWLTVNYLGAPDNGAILAAYLGSLALAAAFLAVGSCLSALTRSQVVAFVLTVAVCFLLLLAGHPLVLDAFRPWAPAALVDGIAAMSFLTHFQAIARGVIDLRDVLYFGATIAASLYATTLLLEQAQVDG
jgi:ABC-2 type transport system permease protein